MLTQNSQHPAACNLIQYTHWQYVSHTLARAHTHTHAPKHARTQAHTHYCFPFLTLHLSQTQMYTHKQVSHEKSEYSV